MTRISLRWRYLCAGALSVYGIWFLLATGVAAWQAYTPLPIWDMWHSIGFLSRLAEGAGWPIWWEQTNEHRLVLSRMLFWAEQYWFGGSYVFLIVVNYLLVFAAITTMYIYLRARAGSLSPFQSVASLVLLTCWLLSWLQSENLIWAFQSQFFLAQLLPLIGFYCLYRSSINSACGHWFVAACTLGVLSIGTMISGIMALPMMLLYACVLRMQWPRLAALSALTAACVTAYFADYTSPGGHGSVIASLKTDPLGMLQYTVQYLGSPFQLLPDARQSMWLGQIFGVAFGLLTLHQLSTALRSPRTHKLELSLLTFILYVAGIAFATAGGRLGFGLESALSSRYTTPTMMAWAAIGILYWPQIVALRGKVRAVAVCLLVVLLILMMEVQMRGTRSADQQHHLRMTGALALVLNVHDARRIGMLIWNEDYGMKLASLAQQHGIGVIAKPPLGGAAQLLGQRQDIPPTACKASVETVEAIAQESRFLLVTGTLLAEGQEAPRSVRILGADGTVTGIGMPGRLRKRKAENGSSERVTHVTFTAYVQLPTTQLPARVVLTAPGTACSVPLTLPLPQ
ncbi:MAG: hypothetical protein EOO32_00530 [Comamonadaceae bacterium]|nr:MAG: hypothetical protein EOO32_00530 [Comamonadaceae bacterium]